MGNGYIETLDILPYWSEFCQLIMGEHCLKCIKFRKTMFEKVLLRSPNGIKISRQRNTWLLHISWLCFWLRILFSRSLYEISPHFLSLDLPRQAPDGGRLSYGFPAVKGEGLILWNLLWMVKKNLYELGYNLSSMQNRAVLMNIFSPFLPRLGVRVGKW